jgi:hypothetical protein
LRCVAALPGTDNLTDNWDDHEFYYKFRLGDMLDNNRYRVFASSGRGVFSTVVRVHDTALADRELIVKIIRNNDTMKKAGEKGPCSLCNSLLRSTSHLVVVSLQSSTS